jgi:RNA polymerase sigma factor (TIGR02999 family)
MRRILIERARQRKALKRGGEFKRLDLNDVDVATLADSDALLLVSDALERLEKEDAMAAQVVKLRFFAGMTNDEAGAALGVSVRTAKRCWTFARAWLFHELNGEMGRA